MTKFTVTEKGNMYLDMLTEISRIMAKKGWRSYETVVTDLEIAILEEVNEEEV